MEEKPQGGSGIRLIELDLVALIQWIAGGDESAMKTLYDKTKRYLFGLVLRILSDRTAAEEVLLDVYTQVWSQAVSYDPQRSSPLAWLITIARARAIDRLRCAKREHKMEEALEAEAGELPPADPAEEASAVAERRKLVRFALDALLPEQRQVIELAYYSGMSHLEIAATLRQPLGTIRTRTRLGMIKLSDMLRPLLEGGA